MRNLTTNHRPHLSSNTQKNGRTRREAKKKLEEQEEKLNKQNMINQFF
jgi:hypothetical protein